MSWGARTRRRLAAGFGVAVLALVAGLGAGFAAFVATAYRPAAPAPLADGIVALTGGAERVETALRLLEAGRAPRLLVSGVARGAGLAELARLSDINPAPIAGRVTLGRAATTTTGNATETAEWAQANAIHSLIVVTAGYHMPRATLELHRAMPQVTLYPVPVQPPAMQHGARLRLLAGEYAKLIGAWLGVSQWVHPPMTAVSRHPVDNSVNG